MASYNKVVVVGNITRDLELRFLQNGTALMDMGLAVNERTKDKDVPIFLDITLFGKTAEYANQYLGKGNCVLVEGRLSVDKWKDKDGNNRTKTKIIGERLVSLTPRAKRDEDGQKEEAASDNPF